MISVDFAKVVFPHCLGPRMVVTGFLHKAFSTATISDMIGKPKRSVFDAFAQRYGELSVVSPEEFGKMGAEKPPQRACAPLAVGGRGCRPSWTCI